MPQILRLGDPLLCRFGKQGGATRKKEKHAMSVSGNYAAVLPSRPEYRSDRSGLLAK